MKSGLSIATVSEGSLAGTRQTSIMVPGTATAWSSLCSPVPFKRTVDTRLMSNPRHRTMRAQAHIVSAAVLEPSTTEQERSAEGEKKMQMDFLDDEDDTFEDPDTPDLAASLTSQQIQELMSVVCDETEFAEIQIKVGGLAVRARRNAAISTLSQDNMITRPAASNSTAPTLPASANELPFQSTASIDESQILSPSPKPSSSVSSMDEDDFDENLLYIGAPKVGILRRGRYVKGRRIGKGPIAEEGSRVKKGQPLAFIEQLGTFVPIEAPQAGEIAAFNIEDGKPVEYKDIIVEISPFFGGHIIGDRKYA